MVLDVPRGRPAHLPAARQQVHIVHPALQMSGGRLGLPLWVGKEMNNEESESPFRTTRGFRGSGESPCGRETHRRRRGAGFSRVPPPGDAPSSKTLAQDGGTPTPQGQDAPILARAPTWPFRHLSDFPAGPAPAGHSSAPRADSLVTRKRLLFFFFLSLSLFPPEIHPS